MDSKKIPRIQISGSEGKPETGLPPGSTPPKVSFNISTSGPQNVRNTDNPVAENRGTSTSAGIGTRTGTNTSTSAGIGTRTGTNTSTSIRTRTGTRTSTGTTTGNPLFPMPNSPQIAASSRREKVKLAPHHSALDWEKFKHSNNVKNIDPSSFPIRITKKELSAHNKKDDYWMALEGKVYNISHYLDFHPGGADILIKFSGKDCTSLFMKYHRWVSFDRILDECFIGFLVG